MKYFSRYRHTDGNTYWQLYDGFYATNELYKGMSDKEPVVLLSAEEMKAHRYRPATVSPTSVETNEVVNKDVVKPAIDKTETTVSTQNLKTHYKVSFKWAGSDTSKGYGVPGDDFVIFTSKNKAEGYEEQIKKHFSRYEFTDFNIEEFGCTTNLGNIGN